MTAEKIIGDLKKKAFKPVYWLEGEEDFFIDQVVKYAEQEILPESEAGFNLTVLYGKDTDWTQVINTCRRYPMFAEHQVVILKEAQEMRQIEKLEAYVDKPLTSTILVVAYKGKKVDGRTKLAKLLKEKGGMLTTKKLYDNELPDWTQNMVRSKGFTINNKALVLLIDHIGNDLSRLSNEIDKLAINLGERRNITEDDIEQYIGVSKEFNVFELQQAIAARDMYKAIRIINYFEANPKAAPIQLILPSIYNFFSKVLMVFAAPSKDENTIATTLGVNRFFVRDYLATAQRYSQQAVERIILLCHHYNLRSIGINDAGTEDMQLMKEFVVKAMR
ncbi:DNA polymerase III, delta subunit [Cnuella takakiae]|uniref:DNA polymerase III subunit delta n=1 Tax=Cnuella takakiae TaxID=1302690 RepID=A0A1M5GKQ1_9BACT|nr:DNA polymerase III subunit delta [Cnuella takakiae]OLY92447.1 DNA polymerase III subunit delta [Cnuella takakiae]SHG04111.1 DNA polymerase III, delta subunit [Cnuella takakiae]